MMAVFFFDDAIGHGPGLVGLHLAHREQIRSGQSMSKVSFVKITNKVLMESLDQQTATLLCIGSLPLNDNVLDFCKMFALGGIKGVTTFMKPRGKSYAFVLFDDWKSAESAVVQFSLLSGSQELQLVPSVEESSAVSTDYSIEDVRSLFGQLLWDLAEIKQLLEELSDDAGSHQDKVEFLSSLMDDARFLVETIQCMILTLYKKQTLLYLGNLRCTHYNVDLYKMYTMGGAERFTTLMNIREQSHRFVLVTAWKSAEIALHNFSVLSELAPSLDDSGESSMESSSSEDTRILLGNILQNLDNVKTMFEKPTIIADDVKCQERSGELSALVAATCSSIEVIWQLGPVAGFIDNNVVSSSSSSSTWSDESLRNTWDPGNTPLSEGTMEAGHSDEVELADDTSDAECKFSFPSDISE